MFSKCKIPNVSTAKYSFTDSTTYVLVPQKLQCSGEYKNSNNLTSAHFNCSLMQLKYQQHNLFKAKMFSKCKIPRASTTKYSFTDSTTYILVPQKLQCSGEYKNSNNLTSAHFNCSLKYQQHNLFIVP